MSKRVGEFERWALKSWGASYCGVWKDSPPWNMARAAYFAGKRAKRKGEK